MTFFNEFFDILPFVVSTLTPNFFLNINNNNEIIRNSKNNYFYFSYLIQHLLVSVCFSLSILFIPQIRFIKISLYLIQMFIFLFPAHILISFLLIYFLIRFSFSSPTHFFSAHFRLDSKSISPASCRLDNNVRNQNIL